MNLEKRLQALEAPHEEAGFEVWREDPDDGSMVSGEGLRLTPAAWAERQKSLPDNTTAIIIRRIA